MNKSTRIILIILFGVFICGLSAFTIPAAKEEMSTLVKQEEDADFETIAQNSDAVLQKHIFLKDSFIDVYGLSQRLLNKRLSSDGKFYRDHDDIIHLADDPSSTIMIDDIIRLTDFFNEKDVPVIIAQTYQRGMRDSGMSYMVDGNSDDYVSELNSALVKKDLDFYSFDYKEIFDIYGLADKDIFFSTDIHYQTKAEYIICNELLKMMDKQLELDIDNLDIVTDISQYDVEPRPFLGNLAQNQGRYYVGLDNFEYYLPRFETDLCLYNNNSELIKSGEFEQSILNGYRENDNYLTYKITDYLKYPLPYYEIVNNLVEKNNILVIMDSLELRTLSYMSLGCHSITILDTRQMHAANHVNNALKKEYDAVIIFPSSQLIQYPIPMILSDYSAEIIACTQQQDGSIEVVVKNNSNSVWLKKDYIKCGLFYQGVDTNTHIELPDKLVVEPGQEYAFSIPSSEFSDNVEQYQVQMLQEGVTYFGPKVSALYNNAQEDDAVIISHTVLSDAERPESYAVCVTVKNTGTTIWSNVTRHRLCVWQDKQDLHIRLDLPDGVVVMPNEEYTFVCDDLVLAGLEPSALELQMVVEGIHYYGERVPVAGATSS